MADSPNNFEFRGTAEIWTQAYEANCVWFGSCAVTNDAITVSAWGRQHVHGKTDLVELRWIWLPYPYFIAISRNNGSLHFSSCQIFRWSRLHQAVQACGFAFTAEQRFYSYRRVRDDKKRYHLPQ